MLCRTFSHHVIALIKRNFSKFTSVAFKQMPKQILTYDTLLDLGHRNQNFLCDTLSYLNWPFCENLIKFASAVLSYCGYTICKVKYL